MKRASDPQALQEIRKEAKEAWLELLLRRAAPDLHRPVHLRHLRQGI